jgi:hypothetical protein
MMVARAAYQENYERESVQETLTACELHKLLAEVIAEGGGDRPVFIMSTHSTKWPDADGLTHSIPIRECFASQPYDGDIVWLLTEGSKAKR